MEYGHEEGMAVPSRQPAARVFAEMLDNIAKSADALANDAANKLGPLGLPAPGSDEVKEMVDETWPALFADYRGRLLNIEQSLATIRRYVDGAEV